MAKGGARPGAGRKPGSPNKVTLDIKALAQEHGPEALRGLVGIATDEQAPHAARVAAMREVLDRGYGKPSQMVGGDPDNPIKLAGKVELVIVDPRAQG
jgi:hypothetical protein